MQTGVGLAEILSHGDHDGCSPSKSKHSGEGNNDRQHLPATWQEVVHKAHRCIGAATKQNALT